MAMKNLEIKNLGSYGKKFLSSLSNFCSKCPLQPKITYIPEIEKIVIVADDNEIEVTLDPTKDKKDVISEIKNELLNSYPIIYKTEEVNLSTEEIDKLIEEGKVLNDIILSKKTVTNKYGRLERIHNKFNEMDIFNFETSSVEKYKCKIPLVFLMEHIKKGEWDLFWKSVHFVSNITKN